MSYIQQLIDIRNGLHKEIIYAVIDQTRVMEEPFELELDVPVQFTTEIYRPYGNEVVTRVITSLESDNMILLGTDLDGNEKTIMYKDVPVELLAEVHQQLKLKKYKLKILA